MRMVTVCETCGDIGFEDALIYCDKCRNYALHLYCLNAPAENIFDEDITWLCEDCEPKIVKPSTIDKSVRSMKNCDKKLLKKRRSKKKCDRWTLTRSVAKKKVKTREGPKGKKVQICEGDKMKVQICDGRPSELEAEGSNNCDGGQNVGNQCREVLKDHFNSFHDVFKSVETSQITTSDALQITEQHSHVAAQPIIDPTWRDEKDFDNLVASMIQDDLAMKAVLDNAELLVFTSIMLPEQYQRFQTKLHLWGVFRAKKFPQLTNDNVAGGEGEKDVAKPLSCYVQSPVSTLSNNVDTSCD